MAGERDFTFKQKKPGGRQVPPYMRRKINEFSLDFILQHFEEEVKEIKGLSGITDYLLTAGEKNNQEEQEKQTEHILRAQVVFLVSAMDYYMHGLTRFGLARMYETRWSRSKDYHKLKVKIDYVEQAIDSRFGIDWLHRNIVDRYGKETMGSFVAIKEQLELLDISLVNVAYKAFHSDGIPENSVTAMESSLNSLYFNRNIIAHQAGKSHETAEVKKITKVDVDNYIKRVEAIVKAIDEEARKRKSQEEEEDAQKNKYSR